MTQASPRTATSLLALLGERADNPAFEELFSALRTRRRPDLRLAAADPLRDWVLIRRHGLELGFVEAAYALARDASEWRRQPTGAGLRLFQLCFYSGRDDIASYEGELPFGLCWTDNRKQVRSKLVAFEAVRRSHVRDCWWLPQHRLTVGYRGKAGRADSVLVHQPVLPWPEAGRAAPNSVTNDWSGLLGEPETSSRLRAALQPLQLDDRLKPGCGVQEADFKRDCGLALAFTNRKRKRNDEAGDRVLGAVRLFRSREQDAREWLGRLPFEFSFDDSQAQLEAKAGRKPDQRGDDRLEGFARWKLANHVVHVIFSNVENQLLQVIIGAPWY